MIPGEGCDEATGVTGIEQAQGILVIHRHCAPPCKRKLSAMHLLRSAGIPPIAPVE